MEKVIETPGYGLHFTYKKPWYSSDEISAHFLSVI